MARSLILGKKAEESKSSGRLLPRPTGGGHATYIKKVVFHLHPTLQPPSHCRNGAIRGDQGWGEFEISLQVFFHDSKDKPVELSTMLKLYPDGDANAPQNPAKPVVSERYDEFVFNHPSEGLRQRLAADLVPSTKRWKTSPHAKWYGDFDGDTQQAQQQQIYQQITAELRTPQSAAGCSRRSSSI